MSVTVLVCSALLCLIESLLLVLILILMQCVRVNYYQREMCLSLLSMNNVENEVFPFVTSQLLLVPFMPFSITAPHLMATMRDRKAKSWISISAAGPLYQVVYWFTGPVVCYHPCLRTDQLLLTDTGRVWLPAAFYHRTVLMRHNFY
jgi:hypothetical protein